MRVELPEYCLNDPYELVDFMKERELGDYCVLQFTSKPLRSAASNAIKIALKEFRNSGESINPICVGNDTAKVTVVVSVGIPSDIPIKSVSPWVQEVRAAEASQKP